MRMFVLFLPYYCSTLFLLHLINCLKTGVVKLSLGELSEPELGVDRLQTGKSPLYARGVGVISFSNPRAVNKYELT